MSDGSGRQIDRDVVVVGGGLVGSVLAIGLARRGVRSTLLERHVQVPEILRGEMILPAGVAVLDRLGLGDRLRAVSREVRGVVLHHPAFDGGACTVDYDLAPAPLELPGEWRPRSLCAWRRPLYEALRAAVRETDGIEMRAPCEVAAIERLGDGRLRLRARERDEPAIAARLVVAADGYRSRLRALMAFEPVEEVERTLVQGFVGRAAGPVEERVHVGIHEVGAAFVFPFRDGLFRSTIEYQAAYRGELRGGDPLARHLEVLEEALPEVFAALGGAKVEPLTPLHVQAGRTVTLGGLVEDGFALAGDAAGSLDPFAGFGMAMGLEDAALLAEVVASAEGDYGARSLRRYERRRHARAAPRREAADALAYVFLDKAEGFADAFAARLARRWRDRDLVLPLVAIQFGGFDPPIEPSVGMKYHFLGLL